MTCAAQPHPLSSGKCHPINLWARPLDLLESSTFQNVQHGCNNHLSRCLFVAKMFTHVQYTQSVTGRKRGDCSRRIVTDCRVVTTRHETLPTLSTVTSEVMSRKRIAEVNFM